MRKNSTQGKESMGYVPRELPLLDKGHDMNGFEADYLLAEILGRHLSNRRRSYGGEGRRLPLVF